MRAHRIFAPAALLFFSFIGAAHATGGDAWPTLAHDASRSARSLGKGALSGAPEIAWKLPMGGALADNQVVTFDADGDGKEDVILIAAGKVSARRADDSAVWNSANIGAVRIVGVADLDGQGAPEIIAMGASPQGLYLLNAATGATLWFQPTNTPAIDAFTIVNPLGGRRLFLAQQLSTLSAYQFSNGVVSPAANLAWISPTSPWSIDMASGDVDGDGAPELIRGRDRGFTVYDAATGGVRCDASNLIVGTLAPSYFPALSAVDVNGDGRAEVVIYDYSYYYSEDAGVYVVSCAGAGPVLAAQTLWSQVWITDTTPGVGNDVNVKQIRYLADGVAELDGLSPREMVYSLWDGVGGSWTTVVRNAATGAVLDSKAGAVIEAVADLDADAKAEVLLRDATGIGTLPKPFFSALRGYDLVNGSLADKGWTLAGARVATLDGRRGPPVTRGAGAIAARQNVNGAGDLADEVYVFQQPQGASSTDFRPGKLLAVHGTDGVILRKYDFPANISGSVLMLASGITQASAVSQSLVMLNDGGLRVLDTQFIEASRLHPGNHARFVSVGSLDGVNHHIFGVDSSDALLAIDGTTLVKGLPVVTWRYQDAIQPESRGYVNSPGLLVPTPAAGASLVIRGHAAQSYEEQALVALKANGMVGWKTDLGAGRQVEGFENFELMDDLDGDGVREFFLTEDNGKGEQQLVMRKGGDGSLMVARPVGDLFPPSGVYLQGHAAADVNGDGKLDVVSALHGSWFVGIDVSGAASGDPAMGFKAIFRTPNGPNGQAMIGDLDDDPSTDLVRANSQNAFGAYERRSLAGNVEVAYQPPVPAVASSDANLAALLSRPNAPGKRDFVWSGMAGAALGSVARLDGLTMTPVWLVRLAGGQVHPANMMPEGLSLLYSPIAVDLDGDGNDEIVVGSDAGFLYALRGSDGSLVFSMDLGAPVVHTIAADLDKDDAIELLCALADGTLVALDAPGAYDATIPVIPDGGAGGMGGMGGMGGSGQSGTSTGVGGGAGTMATSTSTGVGGGGGAMGAGTTGAGGGAGTGGGASPTDTGGCGCKAVGAGGGSGTLSLGLAALVLALTNRGRRRARFRRG